MSDLGATPVRATTLTPEPTMPLARAVHAALLHLARRVPGGTAADAAGVA